MHIIFLSKFQRCFIIVPNKKKKISIALKSFVLLTKKIYKKKISLFDARIFIVNSFIYSV